jgi:hypothetical protein
MEFSFFLQPLPCRSFTICHPLINLPVCTSLANEGAVTNAHTALTKLPIDDIADTNATVITNKRVYYFQLHAEEAAGLDDPRLAYEVRFLYPLYTTSTLIAFK